MINTTTAVSTSGDGSQIPSFTSVSRGVWAAFLMLWMQMWAVSRGSGRCHVWPHGPERAGWSERRGVGWPRWESRAAFFWRSVRLSLAVTLPLACISHSCPAVPPFHPGSCVFENLAHFRGLWEIYTGCFIEGYVSWLPLQGGDLFEWGWITKPAGCLPTLCCLWAQLIN